MFRGFDLNLSQLFALKIKTLRNHFQNNEENLVDSPISRSCFSIFYSLSDDIDLQQSEVKNRGYAFIYPVKQKPPTRKRDLEVKVKLKLM